MKKPDVIYTPDKNTPKNIASQLIDALEKAGFTVSKMPIKRTKVDKIREKELEKFLADKYKFQEEAKKCKMVFKSSTQTGQMPQKIKRGVVAECANPIRLVGLINSKLKQETKRKTQ